ncbi:MAG TPA: VWA domain-containing protein [Candidatus Acidoferrum sp.]|nr:VWA domain-containing protein [Candidatus Acidoferrum sp.]
MKASYSAKFTWLGFGFALLASFGIAPRLAAQTPPSEQAAPAAPAPAATAPQTAPVVIKRESRLVLVDAVVTDKKGNYIRDLNEKDFKVYEDNKEQQVASFSSGADTAVQAKDQKHYLILFFDNSSMAAPDQIQARGAAAKFVQANAGPGRMMAVVDFGGKLQIVQNFTANADILSAAVSGIKYSSVNSNPSDASVTAAPVTVAAAGLSSLNDAESDYGARTMLLAVRSLAKNLRSVPGRKMLVLFSAGFALTPENESELTATIDACNKANVAIYSLDVRGLVANAPGGSARNGTAGDRRDVQHRASRSNGQARLVLTSYSLGEPQRPGGGAGGTGGGAGGGGRGGTGGGVGGTGGGTGGTGGGTGGTGGGRGGTGGTGTGGTGGTGGKGGGGTTGGAGGTKGSPGGFNNNPYGNPLNNPYNQSRMIVPQFPPSVTTNQQILAALAEGTGGFSIFNTNDLLGGLEKIGREQSEFYILGYVPAETPEGSCHTLKVKLNRGGLNVRSRSGYCNARTVNPLDGKPVEKQLELHAAGANPGTIHGALQTPYFYTAPNVARVNLAMEIPPDSLNFNKEKGKYHANVNILGIAYNSDGSIGARFNDTVDLDLDKDEWKQFIKSPYHYQNQFDAAPGTYKLTIVLSGGGDTFGKFESPLQIDAYDGKHFSLGGVAMTNAPVRISDIPSGLDSALLEDRTPLVLKGMQIVPSASNRFKKTDHVILYTEIYEPGLTSATPPRVGFAYHIYDRASNKDLFFSGLAPADNFIQKGNPVIPGGLVVKVQDLAPGSYRLVVQAVDSANNQAPNRMVDFDITN